MKHYYMYKSQYQCMDLQKLYITESMCYIFKEQLFKICNIQQFHFDGGVCAGITHMQRHKEENKTLLLILKMRVFHEGKPTQHS